MVIGSTIHSVDLEILKFLGEMGIRYPDNKIGKAIEYVEKMRNSSRIVSVRDDDVLHSIVFFSVCKDIKPFYKKETWDYRTHEYDGTIAYIEKAASKGWTKQIRKNIQRVILKLHPKVKEARWHRWGKKGDRPVIGRVF